MFKSVLFAAVLAAHAGAALAQDYPSQPIRLVVPHPPGGFTDILARLVSQKLAEDRGWQVIVENKGGGGSTIAENFVSRANPDGYTLLVTGRDVTLRSALYDKLPYNPDKDFAPVSQLVWSPMVLVAHPSLPVQNFQQLVAAAKQSPGKITYASPGNGSGAHLAMEMLEAELGVNLLHVPYKGVGQATTDLLGGQVSLMFLQMAVALPQIRDGKLKPLAVPATRRASMLPDVPTVAEQGVPGFEVTPWFGIMTTAGTPPAVVNKLNEALVKAIQAPDVRKKLSEQGVEAVGSSPAEFTALIAKEAPKWKKLVKDAGVRVD
ncbi:Tripartite tricarboxylate transporter family receptor [Pigmentiphaga humi]|uniref:Tripartite tricarboxylate transporter family receptor n=1 Tax=Pigmentiphaga humi TaxID=2478468 RepID=A0A3P4B0X0_9BURK|nr:tripartite tricarboxylate transporter substrate binding protein [Pigmentiphaga humi]VCU68775.1 Tripartite tricarboxylate transporter family receptor [Pigmentiphaga humi]